jgi:hypothetical protein
VNRDQGTGMNALSWAPVSISLFALRRHHLARADVEADRVRAGLHEVFDTLLGLLGNFPEMVLAFVHALNPPSATA